MSKRTTFSKEFKTSAVKLADEIGFLKASRELEIDSQYIKRWKKDLAPKTKKELENIDWMKKAKKLEKENYYLKEINKVLKKSTAIFSAENLRDISKF